MEEQQHVERRDDSSIEDGTDGVDVYWRPGCPFCVMLFADLRRRRIPVRRHNIWDDPEAAAFVRSAANGNETVPTVAVGDVTLVNPRGRVVSDLYSARTVRPPSPA